MKNKSYLLIFCLPFLVAMQCKKKQNYYIDPKLWYTTNAAVGSYWIMKDTVTGVVDSIIIHNAMTDNIQCYNDDNCFGYSASMIEYSNNNTLFGYYYYLNSFSDFSSFSLNMKNNDTGYGLNFYPIIKTNSVNNEFGDFYYGGKEIKTNANTVLYPKLNVNGTIYDSVYVCNITSQDTVLNDLIYFNHDYGFIKMIQNNPIVKRTIIQVRSKIVRL